MKGRGRKGKKSKHRSRVRKTSTGHIWLSEEGWKSFLKHQQPQEVVIRLLNLAEELGMGLIIDTPIPKRKSNSKEKR